MSSKNAMWCLSYSSPYTFHFPCCFPFFIVFIEKVIRKGRFIWLLSSTTDCFIIPYRFPAHLYTRRRLWIKPLYCDYNYCPIYQASCTCDLGYFIFFSILSYLSWFKIPLSLGIFCGNFRNKSLNAHFSSFTTICRNGSNCKDTSFRVRIPLDKTNYLYSCLEPAQPCFPYGGCWYNPSLFWSAANPGFRVRIPVDRKNKSFIYRTGANPGFHEGVADILSLAVGTASYYQKLGTAYFI